MVDLGHPVVGAPAAVPDAGGRIDPVRRGADGQRPIWFFEISGASGKEKTAEKKKPEEAQKKQTQKQEKPKKAFPKPTLSDIRDAWKALWPPLKKALRRTRQGVRIDPLDVSVILGGQAEPADAAQLYGELHGAVWTGMPVLEQLLVIPRPHIHLDVDFTAEETKILGSVGFSARIGTLLRIGMTVAIPGLRWLLAYMKKKKQAPVGKDESNGHGKEKPAA